MKFQLLENIDDKDIDILKEAYDNSSVKRFIEIDKENFWSYVTETENVYFYKVYLGDILVGTAQCELINNVLYFALVVFPLYRNNGIGYDIVKHVIGGITGLHFSRLRVSIDEANIASLSLFKKIGFVQIGRDNLLIDFEYVI